MKDLTQGSIPKHLINMAIPIMVGMLVQTLYFLVDLYFVGSLGETALAGVSAAGNAMFIIIALTQVLNVGTATLISHAAGRKDRAYANLVFNQSFLISGLIALTTLVLGYTLADDYLQFVAQDAATIEAGTRYLYWMLPNMALQFSLVSIGAGLRGTGIVKPTMLVQMISVLVNILLAPVLIVGWGTGKPMGVAGAGLASSIAAIVAVGLVVYYFYRLEKYIAIHVSQWKPDTTVWKRLFSVGVPAGGEFLLLFVYMGIVYWAIQVFGPSAQAGFGLGSRVMQSLFLPVLAITFAAPAIVGQNFGAGNAARIRETFRWTAIMSSIPMAGLTLICLWSAPALVGPFSHDSDVLKVGSGFLALICWNFVPTGLVFTCSGLFQGLGNTLPSVLSSATRVLTFTLPVVWLSQQKYFTLDQIWQLSIATGCIQALISLYLLRWQMQKRLQIIQPAAA
jgi:putative MATE family efflux protein